MFPAEMMRQIILTLLSVILLTIPSIGCNPAEASAGLTCEKIPRLLGAYRHTARDRRTAAPWKRSAPCAGSCWNCSLQRFCSMGDTALPPRG